MTLTRLALILPTYNFAPYLQAKLEKLRGWKQQQRVAIDIVFSDDGSTDATVSILKKWIQSQDGGWHVVTHPKNTGKGGAVRRGFSRALELKPDLIFFSDCDLHYGLDIIFERMVPALATMDIAIVDRSWRRDRIQATALRKFASAIFTRGVAILTGVAFRDTQAGLKAFRADACRPIFELLTIDGFTFDVEILSIALFYRLRVKQIPITIDKPEASSSVSLLRSSFQMTVDLVKININWKRGRYAHPQLIARIENEVYKIGD